MTEFSCRGGVRDGVVQWPRVVTIVCSNLNTKHQFSLYLIYELATDSDRHRRGVIRPVSYTTRSSRLRHTRHGKVAGVRVISIAPVSRSREISRTVDIVAVIGP